VSRFRTPRIGSYRRTGSRQREVAVCVENLRSRRPGSRNNRQHFICRIERALSETEAGNQEERNPGKKQSTRVPHVRRLFLFGLSPKIFSFKGLVEVGDLVAPAQAVARFLKPPPLAGRPFFVAAMLDMKRHRVTVHQYRVFAEQKGYLELYNLLPEELIPTAATLRAIQYDMAQNQSSHIPQK